MQLASLAWRGLVARPLRTALAVAGIALGVAIVTATLITAASSEQAVRGATVDLLGRADARLRAFADAGFGPRAVQSLRGQPGVVGAAPVSERHLTVHTEPGPDERVFLLLVLGVDPEVEPAIRSPHLVSGRALSVDSPTDALVPASWARRNGLGLGDELRIDGRRVGEPPLVIVGLMGDTGFGALERGDVMVASREALDASLETPMPIRFIDLDLGEHPEPGAAADVAASLTEPFIVETADDVVARFAPAREGFIGVALLLSLVALAIGAFLIGNTLAMTVGERIRDIGLLRAAGTTSGQVMGIVLRQAAAFAIAGSVLGVIGGVVLAAIAVSLLSSTRTVLLAGLPLPAAGLLGALVVGVVVTFASSIGPARRAARVTPLDALRPPRSTERGLLDRLRPVLGAELVVVAGAVALVALGGSGPPVLLIALSLAILVGGAVAAAFVLEPLARVIGRPFEWFFGAQGLLGRLNLSRDRIRTGLTVGSMMIALAAVVALGTVAESARAGTERRVTSLLPGGHAIRTGLPLEVETFRASFEGTPGVDVVSPILELPVVRRTDDGAEEAVIAGIDPNVFDDGGALLVTGASRGEAFDALRAGGAVLVPESLAARADLEVGDVIGLGSPGGAIHELRIAGLLEATLPARTPDGALLVSSANARDRFGATAASLWVMLPQAGIADSAFAASVRETANGLAAQPLTARDLAGDLALTLERFGGLFDAMALVAVIIAGLGVVNTLGIGVAERVREVAILRSHGMTVGQVQAMVVAEAAIMGAIAAVLAIGVGLLVAFTLIGGGASPELAGGLRLPWALLLAVLLAGIGIASLAALYPARVAASLPIVRSLKHFE